MGDPARIRPCGPRALWTRPRPRGRWVGPAPPAPSSPPRAMARSALGRGWVWPRRLTRGSGGWSGSGIRRRGCPQTPAGPRSRLLAWRREPARAARTAAPHAASAVRGSGSASAVCVGVSGPASADAVPPSAPGEAPGGPAPLHDDPTHGRRDCRRPPLRGRDGAGGTRDRRPALTRTAGERGRCPAARPPDRCGVRLGVPGPRVVVAGPDPAARRAGAVGALRDHHARGGGRPARRVCAPIAYVGFAPRSGRTARRVPWRCSRSWPWPP